MAKKRDYKTPEWREYYRKYWHANRAKKLEITYKTQSRPEFKERKKEYDKKWREENKEYLKTYRGTPTFKIKNSAREKLRYAIKTGKIKRLPCEVCGQEKTHGHHTDYRKPLDVMWLCTLHHGEIHRGTR